MFENTLDQGCIHLNIRLNVDIFQYITIHFPRFFRRHSVYTDNKYSFNASSISGRSTKTTSLIFQLPYPLTNYPFALNIIRAFFRILLSHVLFMPFLYLIFPKEFKRKTRLFTVSVLFCYHFIPEHYILSRLYCNHELNVILFND